MVVVSGDFHWRIRSSVGADGSGACSLEILVGPGATGGNPWRTVSMAQRLSGAHL